MTQNTADTLRTRLKESRKKIPVADRQRGSLLIRARLFTWLAVTRDNCLAAGLRAPSVIAAYWPLTDEPDLRPLLTQWDASDIAVALPAITTPDSPLSFRRWRDGTELQAGPMAVMQPPAGESLTPDVILVPTLGFTERGDRMGYGKGYYDRTLASLHSLGHRPTTIGIAWAEGNMTRLDPTYRAAGHDWQLDAVITPENWYPSAPDYTLTISATAPAR